MLEEFPDIFYNYPMCSHEQEKLFNDNNLSTGKVRLVINLILRPPLMRQTQTG